MSGGYSHKTIILQIYLWLSNQLIQYHQEAKTHILGSNFDNMSMEAFALMINARKVYFAINLQPQIIHFFHEYSINFFKSSSDGFNMFSTFGLGAMEAL
jgi:hypothetical protein